MLIGANVKSITAFDLIDVGINLLTTCRHLSFNQSNNTRPFSLLSVLDQKPCFPFRSRHIMASRFRFKISLKIFKGNFLFGGE